MPHGRRADREILALYSEVPIKRAGLALPCLGRHTGNGISCGVLRWLAETERLETVEHISSVSGGTLLIGLVLGTNEWRWPNSAQYLNSAAPRLRLELTTKNVPMVGALRLLVPANWRYIASRANVLAQAIERCWNVAGTLGYLPSKPIWSTNGTTAQRDADSDSR